MAWFRISFAENAFRRLLKERSLTLETLTVDQGIEAMTAFHTDHRPQHGGEDSLHQRRRGTTVTISRRMARADDQVPHTLTLTIDANGGRLTFS